MLHEKEQAAQRLIGEIITQIDTIPDEAVEEVAQYLKGKLEVYEQALKTKNGVNGKAK